MSMYAVSLLLSHVSSQEAYSHSLQSRSPGKFQFILSTTIYGHVS